MRVIGVSSVRVVLGSLLNIEGFNLVAFRTSPQTRECVSEVLQRHHLLLDQSSMKRRFFCFCRSFFAGYDSCVANFTVEDNFRQLWMTTFCALNMPDTDQVLCPLANWLYLLPRVKTVGTAPPSVLHRVFPSSGCYVITLCYRKLFM